MSLTDKIKDFLGPDTVGRLRDARDQRAAAVAPVREEMLRRKLARSRLALSDLDRFPSGVTLFFAPAAGVAPHFASHCILARTLQDLSHPVLLAGCFMAYPRCIAMDGSAAAARVADRHPGLVCLRCGNISANFAEDYGLDVLDIGALLSPQEQQKIEGDYRRCAEPISPCTERGRHRLRQDCGFGGVHTPRRRWISPAAIPWSARPSWTRCAARWSAITPWKIFSEKSRSPASSISANMPCISAP